jgi:hypothetical protein
MPCKQVFLSLGFPLGNLERIGLLGLFEEKSSLCEFLFLDPEDINILGNVVLIRKPQYHISCGCESLALLRHTYLGSFVGPRGH